MDIVTSQLNDRTHDRAQPAGGPPSAPFRGPRPRREVRPALIRDEAARPRATRNPGGVT
jgi:hypothetical protein